MSESSSDSTNRLSTRLAAALRSSLAGVALSAVLVASASAERVVRVTDGDSIVVDSGGNEVEVRIADIDAPELRQPYGKEAKAALTALVGAREVDLELVGGDAYRRIVAHVFVAGHDVGAELVARGLAWVRRAYAPDAALVGLAEAARAERRGLWADPAPVPPWIWRKTGRGPPAGASEPAPHRTVVDCAEQKRCDELDSCEEAIAFLHRCARKSLDADGDGIPCEALCRYYR